MKTDTVSTSIEPKSQEKISKNPDFEKSSSKFSSIFNLWEQKTGFGIINNADTQTEQEMCEPTRMENVPSAFEDNQRRGKWG